MNKIEKEICPVCSKKTLTLLEDEQDLPYFGKIFIFSMSCSSCKLKQSDLEFAEKKEPCKLTFTIENKKDLNIRVVKSANATIKIPQLKMSVTPGIASEGYISNIEGLLQRFKKILEDQRDSAEDPTIRKKAKNLLKKLWKVETGDEKLKIIIEDPSGNSAIISEKTEIKKLK